MSKCPIPLYVVVSTKLNHPEITFGTAPYAEFLGDIMYR